MACSVNFQIAPKHVGRMTLTLAWLLVMAGLPSLVGCGGGGDMPDLGTVTGVVTLDGQPLSGAQVTFSPESGRPSTAETGGDGSYTLQFTVDEPGAVVGTHTVRINTAVDGRDDPKTEQVPAKYNSKTELTAKVESGKNELDFDLMSK